MGQQVYLKLSANKFFKGVVLHNYSLLDAPFVFFNHFVHAFIKNTLIIGKFSPWTSKTKQLSKYALFGGLCSRFPKRQYTFWFFVIIKC